jgi:F-type H+-transporting ATPase subunit delta
MSVETIARRYAAALADVVVNTGETEAVRNELRDWERLISENGDLQSVFGNPAIVHVGKEKVLESLIQRTNPSKTTANFLRVLLRNGRLIELDEINERFAAELEARSGQVSAEIISARDLQETEKSDLRINLEKLTGKRVNLNYSVDGDLIGGVVTRIGSTVYDGSIKTQLNNLKEQLVNE